MPQVPTNWCAKRIVGLALLPGLAIVLCAGCRRQGPADVVIARVQGTPITAADLRAELLAQKGATALQALIRERLVEEAARRAGLEVSPEQLQDRLRSEELLAGSAELLSQKLREQGKTHEQLKRELRVDLLQEKLAEQSLTIPDDEIESYYVQHAELFKLPERVHARMIMQDDEKSAKVVLEALRAGGDFAGLARELSTDPGTKDAGGDMGVFARDDYAPEISEVAFKLQPGQISEVFKGPDGWCIVQTLEKLPPGRQSLAEARDSIRGRLMRQRLIAAKNRWLAKQWSKSQIRILDHDLRRTVEAQMGVEIARVKEEEQR